MTFTFYAHREPSTTRERLEMDLSLILGKDGTLEWCRRNRLRRAAEWLMGCVKRIRERLNDVQ